MKGFAVAACVCAVAGTVGVLVASAATGTGYGYVSEAGVPGAPLAGVYRAGVLAIAAALALLAVALRGHLRVTLADVTPTEDVDSALGRALAQAWSRRDVKAGRRLDPDGPAGTDAVPGRAPAQACARRETRTGRRLDLDRLAGMIAILALAGSAPLAAASGAVPCTAGCPLPPYESASHQDIAHAVASIGGFALAAVAMIVLALPSVVLTPPAGTASVLTPPSTVPVPPLPGTGSATPAGTVPLASAAGAVSAVTPGAVVPEPPAVRPAVSPAVPLARVETPVVRRLRTASRFAAGLAVPLLAAAGLAMLIVGRGLLAGTLERAALAASLGWLVAAAATLATTRPEPADPGDPADEPVAMRRLT